MRNKRYIWLPILLLIYGLAFAILYGPDFVKTGRTMQLTLAVVADILICVLLFFALRKKQNMQ